MAQAGIHGLAAVAVRRWLPAARGLTLGLFIGNLFPDADNLAVAVATLSGGATEGLHRTFTHSLFTIVVLVILFVLLGRLARRPVLANFGLGLGGGILMHTIFDLVIWFNGVQLLWPLAGELNFWRGVTPPQWWLDLMMPAEFLAFALFLWALGRLTRERGGAHQEMLRRWTAVQLVLFALFTLLLYAAPDIFLIPYGSVYLLSLFLVLGIIWRLRAVLEPDKPPLLATAD